MLVPLQEGLCGELGLRFEEFGKELKEGKEVVETFIIFVVEEVVADYAVPFLALDHVAQSVVDKDCDREGGGGGAGEGGGGGGEG